jgi:hypothetical protein
MTPGHLLEGLGREDRPHRLVAGLVPADAGDRPHLREEARVVGVNGEVSSIEPLDQPVPSEENHREALWVDGDSVSG